MYIKVSLDSVDRFKSHIQDVKDAIADPEIFGATIRILKITSLCYEVDTKVRKAERLDHLKYLLGSICMDWAIDAEILDSLN